jgi:uncharacterized protein (DUF983 family)
MKERRTCKRCGREVAWTASGHARAHDCPHGRTCVKPYAERRAGGGVRRCDDCEAGRLLRNQLPLFPTT